MHRADKYSIVVPAKAGTHRHCYLVFEKLLQRRLITTGTVVMGPRLRGDDELKGSRQ
jgi:hypothetical protein